MQSTIPERPSTDHAWGRISGLVGVSLEARLLFGIPTFPQLRNDCGVAGDILDALGRHPDGQRTRVQAHGCSCRPSGPAGFYARQKTRFRGDAGTASVKPRGYGADGRNERASSCRSSKTGCLAKGNRPARTIGWMLVRGAFARLPRPRTEGASVCRNRRHGAIVARGRGPEHETNLPVQLFRVSARDALIVIDQSASYDTRLWT